MRRGLLEIQRSTFLLSSQISSWCGWWWDLSRLLLEIIIISGCLERKHFLYFCWKLWRDESESEIRASKSYEYWADDEVSPSGNTSSVKSGAISHSHSRWRALNTGNKHGHFQSLSWEMSSDDDLMKTYTSLKTKSHYFPSYESVWYAILMS